MLLEVVSFLSPCGNAVGTGSVPSNTTAKAAAGGFPPNSSSGAAGSNSFNMSGDVRIVSPVQCKKRDTLDYSTFKLQLAEKLMPTSTRAIKTEKEASKIPVKITRNTKTSDLTKLVVNDITQITPSNSSEWSFQSAPELSQQKLMTLDKLHEGLEDNITVICKVLKFSETKFLGQAKHHILNATVADATGQIVLDVRNYIIFTTPRKQCLHIYAPECTTLE